MKLKTLLAATVLSGALIGSAHANDIVHWHANVGKAPVAAGPVPHGLCNGIQPTVDQKAG